MANVFGNPITDSTLEAMAEYTGRKITAADRARVAINMKNADSRDRNARTHVENLKRQWGLGVSTLCVVYNATGNTMTFLSSRDWYGHIGPAPYPTEIQNGQWGAFLHVKDTGRASGSHAAVVFRGKNGFERECDYMMAWSNPWHRDLYDNAVWAEARDANHFTNGILDWIHRNLAAKKKTKKQKNLCPSRLYYRDYWPWGDCLSTITTGSHTSPVLEATFTLDTPSA